MANKIKIIIIDDESLARQITKNYLANRDDVEILSECSNGFDAIKKINELKPDLIFLDIQMPKLNGFEMLELLEDPPIIIFTTAYDHYAIKAFEVSAIDYLLKPVSPDELVAALQKASTLIDKKDLAFKIETLLANMENLSHEPKKILLKTQETVYIVNLSEIIRCEADRNYTRFYLTDNRTILVSGSLIDYDETLTPSGFFRAHHSHLINLECISKIEKHKMTVVLKDGSVIPLANRKKDALIQFLEKSIK